MKHINIIQTCSNDDNETILKLECEGKEFWISDCGNCKVNKLVSALEFSDSLKAKAILKEISQNIEDFHNNINVDYSYDNEEGEVESGQKEMLTRCGVIYEDF